jgi:DNA polymerase elongation subunit (family B)
VTDNLKLLFFDLETAPSLAHIWHPTDQYVTHDRLIHGSFTLTWSAKWAGEKTIHSGVLTGKEAVRQDDKRIVVELAEMVREADFLVAHNADRFDVPMFNVRLLALGLEPLGPKRTIDTLKLAKKNLRLPYNKLDYLGEMLGLGRKLKTDFDLWRNCYHGDEKALARMARYNRQDVILLEKVYDRLKPYVKNLPRLVEATDENVFACPSCGSEDLHRRGVYQTNVSTFQKYQCVDCLRYCRDRSAEKARLTVAPL